MKIDRRRNYYLAIDVETANQIGQPLPYEIGFSIIDTQGNRYRDFDYAVQEILFDEKNIYNNPKMMKSAYYAEKLPQYWEKIFDTKEMKVKSIYYIRKVVENICAEWNIKAICAYNAKFDDKALRNVIRYVSKSATAEFLPSLPVIDIWSMACQSICKTDDYYQWCADTNHYSEAWNCKTNAESVYAYLTQNNDFEEAHMGLEDAKIEAEIFAKCLTLKKKIKEPYEINDENYNCMPWKLPQDEWKKYISLE